MNTETLNITDSRKATRSKDDLDVYICEQGIEWRAQEEAYRKSECGFADYYRSDAIAVIGGVEYSARLIFTIINPDGEAEDDLCDWEECTVMDIEELC